jgi:hypothetical protein
VISRTLIIALAVFAALYRASQGAWVESTGLSALAAGLIALRLAPARPWIKPLAWVAFGITALAMLAVFLRQRS